MDEYHKTVSSEDYNIICRSKQNGSDYEWLELYNKYYSYDPRVVKIIRIENEKIIMEKIEGFTLDNKQMFLQLDDEQKRFIVNEIFDIYNKQFNFKDSALGIMDIWAHCDFQHQNLMYSNGKVRLIDPEGFDKRCLKIKENNIKYSKFQETYIQLCCLV